MALADPQTITVNAVAKVMPRIETDSQSATYQLADKTFTLKVSHQDVNAKSKPRVRSLARFDQRAVVPDPLTAVNDYENVGISIIVDRPEVGFTSTQIEQQVAGFFAWCNGAMVAKLFGRES